MGTTLYYFTGTGNTLKVGRDLAQELGGTELVPIPKVTEPEVDPPSECVGILFPVYAWGMPRAMVRFIEKLKPSKDKYFFAVCTYGAMLAGALQQTANQFKSKGIKLSAGFAIRMPGNPIMVYDVWSEKKQQKLFQNAQERIPGIADIIKRRQEQKVEKWPFLLNPIFGLGYSIMLPGLSSKDRNFWVDDKCDSCGLCAKICPVGNIKMSNEKPEWQHNCEQCLACIQWCPREAIQYGKKTSSRKRYHHPDVKMKDLLG